MKNDKYVPFATAMLIVAMAFTRLIPHWPNAVPILGMALVGGALYASSWRAWLVPILAMVLSDIALGIISGTEYVLHDTQIVVYGCVLATCGIGVLLKDRNKVQTTLLGGALASIMFFFATNTAVWATSGMYPRTMSGLISCYAAGLAFIEHGANGNYIINTLVSTWLSAGMLFAANAAFTAREKRFATL